MIYAIFDEDRSQDLSAKWKKRNEHIPAPVKTHISKIR